MRDSARSAAPHHAGNYVSPRPDAGGLFPVKPPQRDGEKWAKVVEDAPLRAGAFRRHQPLLPASARAIARPSSARV